MKRQMSSDNTNFFDRFNRKPLRPNTIAPELYNSFITPVWLEEPRGVEIIELNSSNENEQPNHDTTSHAWSYVNKDEMEQIENSYKINQKARERRRLLNEINDTLPSIDTSAEENQLNTESMDYYCTNNSSVGDKVQFDNRMNCFTIINKNLSNSDNSTEADFGEVEIITSKNNLMVGNGDWNHSDDFYNEEIITYDTDLDQETRTIRIYSFKNKQLLSGYDFATANSSVKESSSSYSTDSSGEQPKDKERVGSPTAATYIPRLDLSLVPTLSTVMEISERNMYPSDDKIKSADVIKRPNNWFAESAKEGRNPVRKHEKSTNIINWMGLSPRERRRVLKYKTLSDSWIGSRLNLAADQINRDLINEAKETLQNNSVQVQVDVDVHVDRSKKNDTIIKTEPESAKSVNKSNNDDNDISSIDKIKFADAVYAEFQKYPRIRKSDISNPIENLEINDWICEKKEKETNVYDYVLERSESILDDKNENVVEHLWLKSTVPFLKPSQWTEFQSTANNPASYKNISIDSIEERENWCSRLIKLFKCCK